MKYNWSIIGHEKQLKQLEDDIESGNLSHAYLLAGANSVGKFTLAKKMAGILQCENNFCHECPTCIQIEKGGHLDTIEFFDNGESIKIGDVRALIERLSMSPQSKYKIVILQSIERMTLDAANSFLKILEEPPARTIFIMTTNDVHFILPTIVSRVRVVMFRSVSVAYLKEKLGELYPDVDAETINNASIFSLGRIGKAVHFIENPDSLINYTKVYHDVQNFLERRNVVDRFSYVEDLVSDEAGHSVDTFFDILRHVLRSKILEGDTNRDQYINTLLKIDETAILLKRNVNDRLALENLMLSL